MNQMRYNAKALFLSAAGILLGLLSTSCQKDPGCDPKGEEELADEWYAGGRLGTTFNSTASAYEDPTPAIEEAGLEFQFKMGEFFFLSALSIQANALSMVGGLSTHALLAKPAM